MSAQDLPLRVEEYVGAGAEWDSWVHALGGGSFCHLSGWRAVMENTLGHRCYLWLARDADGNVCGLLPLTRVRSRLFGDFLVSMPFLNYGGAIGEPRARSMLSSHAAELGRTLGVDLLELRNRSPVEVPALTLSHRKLTVVKDLPGTSEALWEEGLRAKVRSQVRRPVKEGMEVRYGPELLADFYEVFSRTMRDLGTPVLPVRFFEDIRARFRDRVVFAVVVHQDAPVAAGCALGFEDEFEITWAGALREHSRLAPNMLLYWGLMEEAIRRGYRRFNFGRCSPDSGTHRFKRQWGGEDEALPWLQWSASGRVAPPNADSPRFRLATAAWSRLPLAVTNAMGPSLSRLLP